MKNHPILKKYLVLISILCVTVIVILVTRKTLIIPLLDTNPKIIFENTFQEKAVNLNLQSSPLKQNFETYDKIYKLSIRFGTYNRSNNTEIFIKILNFDTQEVIHQETINAEELLDNSFFTLELEDCGSNGKYNKYTLIIESNENDINNTVAVWFSDGETLYNSTLNPTMNMQLIGSSENEILDILYSVFSFCTLLSVCVYFTVKIFFRNKIDLFTPYILVFISLLPLFLYLVFSLSGQNVRTPLLDDLFMIWVFVTAFVLYKLFKCNKKVALVLLFSIIGILFVFIMPIYSPIDEAAHFAYISFIINKAQLPSLFDLIDDQTLAIVGQIPINTAINHEAVQPPFYYFVSATFSFLITNPVLRFYYIRLLGLLALLLNFFISMKTINLLKKHNVIKCNDLILTLFSTLLLLNPACLVRFTTISNECLAIILCSSLCYLFVVVIFEGINRNRMIFVTLLIGLSFLTKNTTLIYSVIVVLLFIYYKKFNYIFTFILGALIIISPWLINNYRVYGSLTGLAEHIKFVLPIVNPSYSYVNVISDTFSIFKSYFIAQEIYHGNFLAMLVNFINVALVILLIFYFIKSYKIIVQILKNKFRFSHDFDEKITILVLACTLLVFMNIFSLVYSSSNLRVSVLIGRYLYITSLPLLILVILGFMKCNNNNLVIIVKCVITIYLSCSILTSFCRSIDSNLLLKKYYEEAVEEFNVS